MGKKKLIGILGITLLYNFWIAVILVGIYVFPDSVMDSFGYLGLGITTLWIGIGIINSSKKKEKL
jgi:hypothetical protein